LLLDFPRKSQRFVAFSLSRLTLARYLVLNITWLKHTLSVKRETESGVFSSACVQLLSGSERLRQFQAL
jgi:hypothetical protein